MEGGSIWKGMLCIYSAKVPGNTTGLLVTSHLSSFLPLFLTPHKVGTILFFSPELSSVEILYMLCIHRAARSWDLPTTPTPAPFPTTTLYIQSSPSPCGCPLEGQVLEYPTSSAQVLTPSTAYLWGPGTHISNSLLTLLPTLFLSDHSSIIKPSYAVPQQNRDFMLLIFPTFSHKPKSPSISY